VFRQVGEIVVEAFEKQPVTEVRELRLDRRHGGDYYPSNARFDAGGMVGEPVTNEVFVEESRVDFPAIRERLGTVRHTIFGRFERTIRAYRTERRRVGVRVVIEDDIEAVHFKLAFA